MRAVRRSTLLRAHPSSTLLLASLNPKPNPNPNLNNEASAHFSAQKACPLLLHRSYRPASPNANGNSNFNPNPNLGNEAPANLSSQEGLEASMEFGDYAFDQPRMVSWSKELCGFVELLGKLDQDVSLYHSASGTPIARSLLKLGEGHVWLSVTFIGSPALVAAAYLAKHDCVLVSGKLFCSSVETSLWSIQVTDFKYVQTEHHNGHIPEGFVREPQMEKLSEEGLNATWREFFKDPSQWQDNRAEKGHNGRPDFEHKTLGYGLRAHGYGMPIWVKKRLQLFNASHMNDSDGNACKEGDTSCQHQGNISRVGQTNALAKQWISTTEYVASKERLWKDLFANPHAWYDLRSSKKSSKSPDFRHLFSDQVLWINSWEAPPWVLHQLALWDSNPQTRGAFKQEFPCMKQ